MSTTSFGVRERYRLQINSFQFIAACSGVRMDSSVKSGTDLGGKKAAGKYLQAKCVFNS